MTAEQRELLREVEGMLSALCYVVPDGVCGALTEAVETIATILDNDGKKT